MPNNSISYIPLGMFRFILSAMVVTGHGLTLIPSLKNNTGIGLQTSAVAIFFLLSGYIVTSAYYKFYNGRPTKFIFNRFLRIYPAFWLAYLFAVIIYGWAGTPNYDQYVALGPLISDLTLFGSYLEFSGLELLSPAWTLIVELKFYLLFFFAFLTITIIKKEKVLLILFLILAMAAYAFTAATGSYNRFFGALQWTPLFTAGAVIYLFERNILPKWATIPTIGVFLIASLHQYDHYLTSVWPSNHLWPYAMLLFSALFVLMLVLTKTRLPYGFNCLDRKIGDLTYTLYLCHYPILGALSYRGLLNEEVGFIVYFLLSIFMAFVLHILSEAPISAIRDKIRGRKLLREGVEPEIQSTVRPA